MVALRGFCCVGIAVVALAPALRAGHARACPPPMAMLALVHHPCAPPREAVAARGRPRSAPSLVVQGVSSAA
eukprot:4726502-Pyramimonas_sp.AAC.1